jgi:hypothetical protein
MALAFDPGERWEYGVNLDWVGRMKAKSPKLPHRSG